MKVMDVKQTSSKKMFFYISASLVVMFATFLVIVKSTNQMPELLSFEVCQSYYLFSFMGLCATAYVLDTNGRTRKEAGYLLLFAVPTYITLYLLICMLVGGQSVPAIIIMLLIMVLVFVAAHFTYKYLIPKIMNIKNGYQVISFVYMIVILTTVLFISFHFMS